MWFRPSGYVIGALLAGAISVVGLGYDAARVLSLVALWVVLDLCLGTFMRRSRQLARPSRSEPSRSRHAAVAVSVLVATAALTPAFPEPVRWVIGGSVLAGLIVSLLTTGIGPTAASALRASIQVAAAWSGAYLLMGADRGPLMLLAVVAAVGTGARLWPPRAGLAWSVWTVRLAWLVLFSAIVAARQPLLAGLVAITACADDLYRLQPERRGHAGALAAASWVATWLLVSVAATYWGAIV